MKTLAEFLEEMFPGTARQEEKKQVQVVVLTLTLVLISFIVGR